MERFRTLYAHSRAELVILMNTTNLGLGRVIYFGANDNPTSKDDLMMVVVDMAFIPVITHEDYVEFNTPSVEVDFEELMDFPTTLSA